MPADRFTILGSSSGMARPDRATSGYLLTVGGRHTLIDCGGAVTSSFLRRGFDPLDVDRAIISHTHPDHVTELPLFLQLQHLAGREDPFDVYLPSEFLEPFRAYMAALYLMPEKLNYQPRYVGYGDGFRLESDFTLTAFENAHLKHNAELINRLGLPNRMQSHSFAIEVGERRLFYSADIASFDEISDHLTDCDYVVMETTHIDLDAFTSWAADADVGRFVITHLDDAEQVRHLNEVLQQAGVQNYVCAVDGLELPL